MEATASSARAILIQAADISTTHISWSCSSRWSNLLSTKAQPAKAFEWLVLAGRHVLSLITAGPLPGIILPSCNRKKTIVNRSEAKRPETTHCECNSANPHPHQPGKVGPEWRGSPRTGSAGSAEVGSSVYVHIDPAGGCLWCCDTAAKAPALPSVMLVLSPDPMEGAATVDPINKYTFYTSLRFVIPLCL